MATEGQWLITKSALKTYGLNDLGENFKSREIIPTLVRESIQNGLDAKAVNSHCVTMKFGYSRIDPNEIPGVLTLKRVFQYCRDFPHRSKEEKKFFEEGQRLLNDTTNKIGLLRISDYGTCGLHGAKTNADGSRWKGLVMTSGAGNDDGRRGGGFGLGKDALYLASKLRTVFFSTIEDEENYAAHMGVACLATFKYPFDKIGNVGYQGLNNQQADRNIFYCAKEYNAELPGCSPSIPGIIKFSDRKTGEYGTDVFIPGFESGMDLETLSATILGEVLKSFIVAISEGTLIVELPNGQDVQSGNLEQRIGWYKHYASPPSDSVLVSELYELAKRPWKHSPSVVVGPGINNFPEGAFDYKFKRAAGMLNQCFVTRAKGMVVHTVKDVCGTTSAIGMVVVRDSHLNSVFKRMENSRHDKFEVTNARFSNKKERENAKAQLKKFRECAGQWAEQEVGVKIVDTVEAILPDELDELMDVCAGQFTINGIKAKTGKKSGIGGVRVKRHKRKSVKVAQAIPANLSEEDRGEESESVAGVVPGQGHNQQKRGNPVNGKKYLNPNAPEANGFVLKNIENPTFYAIGKAETGKYRFIFRVPKSRTRVCFCFSSTAENDGHEVLTVKSVRAVSVGATVAAMPDLGNTVVSFENVTGGQIIEAEIEFNVAHYCYTEVRYYEKKNI